LLIHCDQIRPRTLAWGLMEFSVFRNRVCVTAKEELRKMIHKEGHKSSLSLHPSMTKMYKDLKETFLWSRMKKGVEEFVSSCLVC